MKNKSKQIQLNKKQKKYMQKTIQEYENVRSKNETTIKKQETQINHR